MERRRIKRALMMIEVPEGSAPEAFALGIMGELKKECFMKEVDGRTVRFSVPRTKIGAFKLAAKKFGIPKHKVNRELRYWEWRNG